MDPAGARAFLPHEAARRFLGAFGGLATYGWPADPVTTRSGLRFDPRQADWQDEAYARMSRRAGTPLYPVDSVGEGGSLLGIAEGGELYAAAGDRVELLGRTADEALDRLVATQGDRALPVSARHGRPPEPVPRDGRGRRGLHGVGHGHAEGGDTRRGRGAAHPLGLVFDLRHPGGILSGSIGQPPATYGRLAGLLGRVLMLRASRREDRKRVPQYSSS
ncbi:SUKH-3 domain-containing protein [Streptomyces sp. NPDC048409]|uniref:SUKH-3 domain-containing protein n=1 Tax=Streptomyces sp. NPDC048409 TaxID=3154723 RepID=UPI00342E5904